MSLNPNIHAATYFRFPKAWWEQTGTASQKFLDKYGPIYHPSEDPEVQGELMSKVNTSLKQMITAARAAGIRDVDESFEIQHGNGQAPKRGENMTAATHVMFGMRNVDGTLHEETIIGANGRGLTYGQVALGWDSAVNYINPNGTGPLPE